MAKAELIIDESLKCRDCPSRFIDFPAFQDHIKETCSTDNPHTPEGGIETMDDNTQATYFDSVSKRERREQLVSRLAEVSGLTADEVIEALQGI